MTNPIDVLIIGAGPVGLATANFLGGKGHSVRIVERMDALIDYPRAIGLDDESLRAFQALGVADDVVPYTTPFHTMRILTPAGRTFAAFEPMTTELGWPRRNAFNQPETDKQLFNALQQYPSVTVSFGTELAQFEQDQDSVTATLRGKDGDETVTARFMVACDGGNSFVRRQLNIGFEGETAPNQWVVVDIANDPIGSPHVYLRADPERPYVSAALPLGIRRFEFMLMAGEKAEDFDSVESLYPLMAKLVPNPKRVEVMRHRVYTHNARIASQFRQGNIFLAGDAAHLMPVWQGQGYNSGIRDAANLGWKLSCVLSGQAEPALLDSYHLERRDHAKAMIDLSVLTGHVLAPPKVWHGKVRDVLARLMDFVPPVKRYFLEMRFKPAPQFKQGALVQRQLSAGNLPVGKMFIQPTVTTVQGTPTKLDDVIGNHFAIVAWATDPLANLSDEQSQRWRELGARFIRLLPANQVQHAVPCKDGVVTLGDEGLTLRRWFAESPSSIVFLRPDRYIAAAASPLTVDDVSREALRALQIIEGD